MDFSLWVNIIAGEVRDSNRSGVLCLFFCGSCSKRQRPLFFFFFFHLVAIVALDVLTFKGRGN